MRDIEIGVLMINTIQHACGSPSRVPMGFYLTIVGIYILKGNDSDICDYRVALSASMFD
jgi:hypothetical protein